MNSQGLCILLGLGCAPSGEWSIAEQRGAPIIFREPMAPGLGVSQQWDPLKQSSYWNIAKTFWDTVNLLFSVIVLHDDSWKVKAGNYISQTWSVLFWKGSLLIGTKQPQTVGALCACFQDGLPENESKLRGWLGFGLKNVHGIVLNLWVVTWTLELNTRHQYSLSWQSYCLYLLDHFKQAGRTTRTWKFKNTTGFVSFVSSETCPVLRMKNSMLFFRQPHII